ncbi:hypothetical protein [Methylorubrum extorquens]|uniref:hypothetical protein n=1 Tax=Methylorubrum extorquens TaxID=408 RepID=UPI00209F1E9E|nr:hypothetical protein [Methylorubrum extorquens]MCP1539984.1 hypothetical protein [Methylorubrum extorquens]
MSVQVGQVWMAADRLKGGEARYVRVDAIDTIEEVQPVLGLTRTRRVPVARVSTRPASAPEFRRSNRFIRLERFGRAYRLIKDAT